MVYVVLPQSSGTFSTESFCSNGNISGWKRLGQGQRCSCQNINLKHPSFSGGNLLSSLKSLSTKMSSIQGLIILMYEEGARSGTVLMKVCHQRSDRADRWQAPAQVDKTSMAKGVGFRTIYVHALTSWDRSGIQLQFLRGEVNGGVKRGVHSEFSHPQTKQRNQGAKLPTSCSASNQREEEKWMTVINSPLTGWRGLLHKPWWRLMPYKTCCSCRQMVRGLRKPFWGWEDGVVLVYLPSKEASNEPWPLQDT